MYNADNPSNDRRKFRRHKLTLNAFYRINAPTYVRMWYGYQEFEAYTLDISEGGIGLLTNLDIPVSSILTVKITLYKLDREGKVIYFSPGELTGEVRSKAAQDNKSYRLSISFVNINSVVATQISEFIASSR